MGGESLELMSGGIDKGESPLEAAQRELREELGFVAKDWMDLGVVKAFTTVMDSPNYMFLARGLEFVGRNEEDWEDLEIIKVPFELSVNMVMESKITHAASCVCIMKAKLLMDLMKPLD
jgi:ADP-ribose pyrophosphatase